MIAEADSVPAEAGNLSVLILVTCQHPTFKDKYALCIRQWLTQVAGGGARSPALEFTEIHVISSEIPPLDELKKFDGIVISGSFSRISDDEPWMRALRRTILLCYLNQIPLFAICFGFQILCQAFGSSFLSSPHGFNFGAFRHALSAKALPFFRPYLREYHSDPDSRLVFDPRPAGVDDPARNGTRNGPGASASQEDAGLDAVTGIFSHNDIITSLPDPGALDLAGFPEPYRSELRASLAELVATPVAATEKVPVVGLLVGNRSRTFMVSVQLHPEFDTALGRDFFTQVLELKLSQGVITREEYERSLRGLGSSNSGFVYGRMALALFARGHLPPSPN